MQRRKLKGNQCQCSGCGEAFRTVRGFDEHRTGKGDDRRCNAPAVLREWGFTLDAQGFWRMAKKEGYTWPTRTAKS
jgi:hypothetical protein